MHIKHSTSRVYLPSTCRRAHVFLMLLPSSFLQVLIPLLVYNNAYYLSVDKLVRNSKFYSSMHVYIAQHGTYVWKLLCINSCVTELILSLVSSMILRGKILKFKPVYCFFR